MVILPSRLRWIGECAALIQLADHIGSPIIPSRASAAFKGLRSKAKYGFYLPPKDSQSFAEYRAIYGEPRIASELDA